MSDEDKNKDNPWGKKRTDHDGPPDIGHFFKSLFGGWLSKRKPRPVGPSSGGASDDGKTPLWIALVVIAILLIVWAVSGIFVVQQTDQVVLTRFGQYTKTVGPGVHWMPQLIDTRYPVNISRVMQVTESGLMLTSQENIVQATFAVKYRISDPKAYLFNAMNPFNSLQQAIDSSMRQVVGQSTLNEILTTGRTTVREKVEKQIKTLVKKYNIGLSIVDVDMQEAGAPDQVKDAFDDVIKAREDQVTLTNQGKTYANKVVPIAKGQASRIMQQAKADAEQSILEAQGDVSGYLALLPQYKAAPNVTEERMYLSTLQSVLSNSHVTLMDTKGNSNLFYMPGAGQGLNSMNINTAKNTAQSTNTTAAAAGSSNANNNITSLNPSLRTYTRWKEAQS